MSTVAHPIVNAGRNHHAGGPAGQIMIKGLKRMRAAHSTGPKQLAQMLFRFGVYRTIGIAGGLILSDQAGDPLELRITVR
jgi:hypothetical protein